ncbi:zinc finger MYM-type protein 1, partial [Trichonephila inaurata madagascariensis]
DIQEAKYFSLSVDSVADISHTDQLTAELRYVRVSDEEVADRFLAFLPIKSPTGEALASTVLTFLKKCNIDIKNLREQSYDNAANMSECYNGLQAHSLKINQLAHYIP